SPRRELVGEPDAGNLHLRFEEGKVSRATASLALLPTLPALIPGAPSPARGIRHTVAACRARVV
ncbi:MAG: hypothetical protein ACR2L2_11775, partial [Acidobacteriota bacterium]